MVGRWQVLDTCMDHEMEEIQNETLIVPQVQKGLHALPLEGLIVRVLVTTHSIYHFLTYSNRRLPHGLRWRVFTKDETEINMEHMPSLIDHQVLQVTITHRHQVCDRAISGARLYVHVNHLLVLLFIEHLLYDLLVVDNFGDLLDALGFQEGQDASLVTIDVLDGVRVVHEFQHAVVLGESQGLVGCEFKV
jgi:hypothetical protein